MGFLTTNFIGELALMSANAGLLGSDFVFTPLVLAFAKRF
jgi:hypothetical protein